MSPEMPPLRAKRHAEPRFFRRRARSHPAQQHHHQRRSSLHAQQPERVLQVPRKVRDQRTRYAQVTQRHTLIGPAPRPRHSNLCAHPLQRLTKDGLRISQEGIALARVSRPLPRRSHRNGSNPLCLFHVHARLSPPRIMGSANGRLCPMHFSTCQCQISQSHRFATAAKSLPGFTTCACPTAASIGRSSGVFPYACESRSSIRCSCAMRFNARNFSSPYIASPSKRPVHLPSRSSIRVAHASTWPPTPRDSSSHSTARATLCASASGIPLTSTILCPCRACHAVRSNPSSKKTITSVCCKTRSHRTPLQCRLLPCTIAAIPVGSNRNAS